MATKSDVEALIHRLVPDPELRKTAVDLRNRGHVERTVVGPKAAQGRVRGRRGDTGYNVRVSFEDGSYSCGCAQSRVKACEHVAAFLVAVIAFVPAVASEEGTKVAATRSIAPDPAVEKFLTDLFPGIGPKRAREVARVFRNVPDLLAATERQLRDLPEIGPWAASALRERLDRYSRLSDAKAPAPKRDDDERKAPAVAVDMTFIEHWRGALPEPQEEAPVAEASAIPRGKARPQPLAGQRLLVQATKAGPIFFRPENAANPVFRRVLTKLTEEDPGAARASPRRVWVSPPDAYPRFVGRLEALGARQEPAKLVDLPFDGLALYVDATGRRARFQAVTEGAEEAFPGFVEILQRTGSHVFDEVSDLHLILPKDYPSVRQALTDQGALLVRKRLRPVKEITEWKEPSEEEWAPGTPKKRATPDLAPFIGAPRPPGLRPHVQLYHYQEEGVAFIRATNYVAYLGDQPGLGKTLQAIVAALHLPGRILVVCPAGARNVWKREINASTTEDVFVVQPSHAARKGGLDFGDAKFVIASYDGLLTQRDAILRQPYDLVILDEAHYVKNKEAERTKAVHEGLRAIPRRVLLSGTPVMNRAEEVRKQLEFLYPDEWGNEMWFRARFVQPLVQGVPEVRRLALQSLRGYLEGIILRRRKADVLRDLPERHVLTEHVRLSPVWRKEYEAEAALLREHMRTHRDTAFGAEYETTRGHVMRLRQLASNAKGEHAERYVRDLLKTPGEKVVVFAVYLQHLEALEKSLAEYDPVSVTGSVNDKDRATAVKRFQEDPGCRVFLGQLVAAGTALTLTAARHVVFVDLDWNPANHEQAGDRVHRISQTREVFLHYLIAGRTVDEDVAKLLDMKSQDTALLLDGDEDALGLLARRRQARLVARLALQTAMTADAPTP
ncbi:MAG TPA: SNF2-related protein [Candidatus Thermoplasmatota archaeon]|nr:SNF2-related protein [Candidatus Thermoplasmatota archaeon]